jgi:ABC-type thiamin/hydroxymethylpyrimidine transport system permease subunit
MTLAVIAILIAVAFALAFLVESLVEYLIGTPMEHVAVLKPWKWSLMYIAAVVGVALALYWKIDLIAIIANGVAQLSGVEFTWQVSRVGQILSGLIIGRGSNFLHDFLANALKKPELPS